MDVVKVWHRNALTSRNEYPCALPGEQLQSTPSTEQKAAALSTSTLSCHSDSHSCMLMILYLLPLIIDLSIKREFRPHMSQFEQNWCIWLPSFISYHSFLCYDKIVISAISKNQISPLSTYQALTRKYRSAVICKISLISSPACCPANYPCFVSFIV